MPSIDASLLPLFFLLFSLLLPIFFLFLSYPSAVPPPLSPLLPISHSLPVSHLPSLVLVCISTATTRLLSLHSVSPITVSPFFFFPCPHPFTSSTRPLAPPPPAISPSHCGDWQESLALPQATCLRPHSSIHLLLYLFIFFLLLVCFVNDDHQTDAGEKSKSRGVASGNKIPLSSLKCVTMEMCVNRAPV